MNYFLAHQGIGKEIFCGTMIMNGLYFNADRIKTEVSFAVGGNGNNQVSGNGIWQSD